LYTYLVEHKKEGGKAFKIVTSYALKVEIYSQQVTSLKWMHVLVFTDCS
jgi:hypothetical protein